MKCCVLNCFNDDDAKATNKSKGITFHKFPTRPNHFTAWLKFLAIPSSQLNSRTVVCSEHFEAKDFYETRSNQRRIKCGAVPSILPFQNRCNLKVCKVCLSLDVKMYDMIDFKLNEMFQNITGISACHKDITVHYLCWECAARLTAAAAFRDKALLSDALLKDLEQIQLSHVASIKETCGYLKPSLTVQKVFTIFSSDETIDNQYGEPLLNVDVEGDTETETNQEESMCEEFEPLVDMPIKLEMEADPIAENNTNMKEDDEGEFEEQVNNYDANANEKQMITVEDDKEEKPKLDVNGDVVDDSDEVSSGEDTAHEVTINEVTKIRDNKVGTVERKSTVGQKDSIKEILIEMKKNGALTAAIAGDTRVTQPSMNSFSKRYCKDGYAYRRSGSGQSQDTERVSEAAEGGEELVASTPILRRQLKPGSEHVFMTTPVLPVGMKKRMSKHKELHDYLKQRIIALKQEGVPTRRVARILNTTHSTVRKWWVRWRDEGHLNNIKTGPHKKRKTTPQEDQLLIERVMQEPSIHTPSLAKELGVSTTCVRNRLKEAGFKHKQKKALVPLRSGRSHKVDEDTKQQIISMKQNGISVTEIANQFRVTRTSVYLWWRRWCKENNVNVTSDNITNTATEQDQSPTEDSNTGNSAQPPIVISSYKSVWQKLPDVEFVS